ncbi:MAG: dTMP kinase [Planctomycetaceae bacterium]|nr:dTMP kinase [Planctomycetaceae bacterium]
MTGFFFSFDGIDGVGKTTQMDLLGQWLEAQGHDVVQCRDPGGTSLGEALREIVLHKTEHSIGAVAELLLYMSSRAQLVEEVIRPAIAAHRTVISDRFLLSNVAYQGHAGGVAVDDAWQVGWVATGGLSPCLTFVLDMPVERASSRLTRELDRMESRGPDFLNRVRKGFLNEARQHPDSFIVIDADRTIDEIQTDIRSAAKRVLQTPLDEHLGEVQP